MSVELIERFYGAFARRDGAGMEACYTPDVHFSDPVFADLRGPEAGAMWRMLTERGTDLRVELLERSANGDRGSARWRAHYTFSQTGRPVVNDVRATLRFADGLIADHVDDFDFHRWARQALGTSGLLLGWTPLLRNAVRRRARAGLDEYLAALGLGDRRLVGQHPLVGVAAADEAALAQRAQGERDGRAPGADEATELLLGHRQTQDDAVGADVAATVGQVPEQPVQAILDPRQVAEGQRDGRAPRALVDALDQAGGERRIARDALGEGGVEDEQARGLEDLPARLEADDALLGAVVGPEQVALGHELGPERLGALEVAHEQAAQHEQPVAAADALGRRVGAPAPARDRHAAGHRRRARLGQVAADPSGQLAIGIEEPDCLDRALPAGPRKAPAGGG